MTTKVLKIKNKMAFRIFSENSIGIFETLRAYHGKIFRLQTHLERLEESAKTAGVALPFNRVFLGKKIQAGLKTHSHALSIRVTLFGGEILIHYNVRTLPALLSKKGVDLKTSPVQRNLANAVPSQVKTSDYQNPLLATLEPGALFDWVLLDKNGFVTEVRTGNIFVVQKEKGRHRAPLLVTPPSHGILNGVTRRVVIECAREAGMKVQERPLMRHEVYNAAEAFLTNTSWEILPIRSLDQRKIGLCLPGRITVQLQQRYKKKVQRECR
ncbi:MAG: aminotransferase class IV family protein [Candidatus Omnitrophica bacterium]|nr:aminotransferase class IV family protein [Candidatus Omnitrophota bacterium]